MKYTCWSILVALSLLFKTNVSISQAYHPYLKQGKKWRIFYLSYGDSPYPCDPIVGGKLFTVSNDTTINGKTFSRILKSEIQIVKQCPAGEQFNYINTMIFSYYREDSTAKKVYSIKKINSQWVEKLVFDFGIQIGDSIPYKTPNGLGAATELYPLGKGDTSGYFKITTVSSTNWASNQSNNLKSYTLVESKNKNISNKTTLTEGIGGIVLFNEPIFFVFEAETKCDCVTETNNVLARNGDYDCTSLFNVVLNVEEVFHIPETFPPTNFTEIVVSDIMGRKLAVLQNQEEYSQFCHLNQGKPLLFQAYTTSGVVSKKLFFFE